MLIFYFHLNREIIIEVHFPVCRVLACWSREFLVASLATLPQCKEFFSYKMSSLARFMLLLYTDSEQSLET